jgi:hypothetical protein
MPYSCYDKFRSAILYEAFRIVKFFYDFFRRFLIFFGKPLFE